MRREERMRAVVEAIARYHEARGFAPSVRDVVDEAGLSSNSVAVYWLRACEEAGLLVRAPGLSRAIALTPAGHALLGEPMGREAMAARVSPPLAGVRPSGDPSLLRATDA